MFIDPFDQPVLYHLYKIVVFVAFSPLLSVLFFVVLASLGLNRKDKGSASDTASDWKYIRRTFLIAVVVSIILYAVYLLYLYFAAGNYPDYLFSVYAFEGHSLNIYNISILVLTCTVIILLKKHKIKFNYDRLSLKRALELIISVCVLIVLIALYVSALDTAGLLSNLDSSFNVEEAGIFISVYMTITFVYSFGVFGELLYRGVFLPLLTLRYGNAVGLLLSVVLFAIGFGHHFPAFLVTSFLGLLMGLLYIRGRNMVVNIIAIFSLCVLSVISKFLGY